MQKYESTVTHMAKWCLTFVLSKNVIFPPHLFGMYIDELENYVDEIDGDFVCTFDMVVTILLYANNVVSLSK